METQDKADTPAPTGPPPDPARREFVKKSLAVLVGGAITTAPVVAGLVVFTDPLRKGAGGAPFIDITPLSALPADDLPRKFAVIADRRDAWNYFPASPVGAVYLKRSADGKVRAFSAICPHAGCFVDAQPDGSYRCPCHDSEFDSNGAIRPITRSGAQTVSPRGLDELEVDQAALAAGAIRVRFMKFQAGTHVKIPTT